LFTIASRSVRVESVTGSSWFCPKDGGSLGSGECWCETAGRGLGYNRGRAFLVAGDAEPDGCACGIGGRKPGGGVDDTVSVA